MYSAPKSLRSLINSVPLLRLCVCLRPSQKLLGNSLLKLEGDDRLDINCTLPLTDQVLQLHPSISIKEKTSLYSYTLYCATRVTTT